MKVVDLQKPEGKSSILEAFDFGRAVQDYIRQYKNLLSDDECQR